MYDLVLVAAGGALAGYALAWVRHRPRRDAASAAAQDAYECRCGQTFYDEQPAKEHAIKTHNAPPQAGEWRFLFVEGP